MHVARVRNLTIDIILDGYSLVAWPEHSRLIWLVLEAGSVISIPIVFPGLNDVQENGNRLSNDTAQEWFRLHELARPTHTDTPLYLSTL